MNNNAFICLVFACSLLSACSVSTLPSQPIPDENSKKAMILFPPAPGVSETKEPTRNKRITNEGWVSPPLRTYSYRSPSPNLSTLPPLGSKNKDDIEVKEEDKSNLRTYSSRPEKFVRDAFL